MERTSRDLKEVIKIGRILLRTGLVLGTWGNISIRAPGRQGFFITPSGVPYSEMRPQDLVFVDFTGKKREGKMRPSTETPLHAAIYLARQDVHGIIHTHSPFSSVFAVNRMEIPPVLEEVAQIIGGSVRVAPYAPPGSGELAEAAVSALEGRTAVLLANHGLVGVGSSLKEALLVCQVVEKAAQVFLWAKLSGAPCLLAETEVQRLRENFIKNYGQRPGGEDDEREDFN
ncbi:MAG: class II aldolase/adducin family protein [Firmicutes bacterium]|nr:class II aldolase/adducin family protein [Bacillota bacterium]